MELADRLEKQIRCAAALCTAKLARGELPDDAALALAVAGGETAVSLMAKTQERIDRRESRPVEVTGTVAVDGVPIVAPVDVPARTSVTDTVPEEHADAVKDAGRDVVKDEDKPKENKVQHKAEHPVRHKK